jgi:hypothetical protein
MKRAVLLTFTLLPLAVAAQAEPISAAQIGRNIHAQGARPVVQSLDRTHRFDSVLDRIASGSGAWVRLAPQLAKGTDAGDSFGLTVALAEALPKNPAAVLAVLDDGPVTGANVVCAVPFVEPAPGVVQTYLDKAIPAVKGVRPSAQTASVGACLDALHHAKASLLTQK